MLAASILSYLDRELAMVTTQDGYELRHGDAVLATLGDGLTDPVVECVTRDGSWTFTTRRGNRVEVGDGEARYDSGVLHGGRIRLPDGTRFRLRPVAAGTKWRVQRSRREWVLDIRTTKGPWVIAFGPAAREVYQLPLLTMLSFHATIVESRTPFAGGGDGGGVGF